MTDDQASFIKRYRDLAAARFVESNETQSKTERARLRNLAAYLSAQADKYEAECA